VAACKTESIRRPWRGHDYDYDPNYYYRLKYYHELVDFPPSHPPDRGIPFRSFGPRLPPRPNFALRFLPRFSSVHLRLCHHQRQPLARRLDAVGHLHRVGRRGSQGRESEKQIGSNLRQNFFHSSKVIKLGRAKTVKYLPIFRREQAPP
jgi:hypothetical protein